MRVEHTLPEELVKNRPLRVLVVGAGGTGSAIVMGLPYLDQAMRVWGHRFGLTVVLMDADVVTEMLVFAIPISACFVSASRSATSPRNRSFPGKGSSWDAPMRT
jgi:hypothetical protein